jgi:hypothetical protein
MRTIGFATSPGILRVVGIVPLLAAIVFFIVALWMLATMVVAVRQALDLQVDLAGDRSSASLAGSCSSPLYPSSGRLIPG